jgi:predicted glutamine amidotransferase
VCRLLGVIATRRDPLRELLADDLAPFVDLACEHPDGWGIGHIDSVGRVAIAKGPARADQSARFSRLAAETVTDAAILHLRLASANMRIAGVNTHPFGDASGAFAHNGYFTPADALDALLGPGVISAQGDTDSERYYLAIRRGIDNGMAPATAISVAAAEIRARATKWVSLNCLFLTPRALYAYADHDPGSEVSRRRGPRFFDLRCRVEQDRIVVASEGWPQPADRWLPLPERRVVEIPRHDPQIILHENLDE